MLPRLPQGTKPEMQAWWQQVCEAIEAGEGVQSGILTDIALALSDAGVAMAAAQQRMPAQPAWKVAANIGGTVLTGQLPRHIAFKRYEGGDEVTYDSEWSISLVAGAATATIGHATGVVNLTALAASSLFEVQSIRNGIPLTVLWPVEKITSVNTASINAATMAAISDEVIYTSGATGVVTLGALFGVLTADATPAGAFPVFGIWRWWNGAAFVDVGTEVESDPDATITLTDAGDYLLAKGSLSVPGVKSGLTASTAYRFQLYGRNSSGTRTMFFNGELNGVGT